MSVTMNLTCGLGNEYGAVSLFASIPAAYITAFSHTRASFAAVQGYPNKVTKVSLELCLVSEATVDTALERFRQDCLHLVDEEPVSASIGGPLQSRALQLVDPKS